ncbi:hypothetical protein KIPB_010369 [Kipferlia bialata]|uniref:Kelch-type beta propeller n=1 Tax=Kipferlia bialata TaxID=797122 RepID=A0A391NYS2_9EUKA|nr:hypothetical protein KIPB_010369 [Kipferlia bialata]|eukprot:g10369.t1
MFDIGGSRVMVAGGFDKNWASLSDAWLLDTDTKQWTQVGDLPRHLSDGRVIVSHADTCLFPGAQGVMGFSMSLQDGDLVSVEEPWTFSSRGTREPPAVEACLGIDNYQHILLSSLVEGEAMTSAYLYDVVSQDLIPCQGVPVRSTGVDPASATLLNPTTAIVVGITDTVVVHLLPRVLSPECCSDREET